MVAYGGVWLVCWFVGAVLVVLSVSVAAGAASADSEGSPGDLSTPAPGDLKATLSADDVVMVTWTAPAGIVKEYQVYRRAAIKGDKYKRIAPTSSTSYWSNAEVLRSGFEYYYRVKAVDSQGACRWLGIGFKLRHSDRPSTTYFVGVV